MSRILIHRASKKASATMKNLDGVSTIRSGKHFFGLWGIPTDVVPTIKISTFCCKITASPQMSVTTTTPVRYTYLINTGVAWRNANERTLLVAFQLIPLFINGVWMDHSNLWYLAGPRLRQSRKKGLIESNKDLITYRLF